MSPSTLYRVGPPLIRALPEVFPAPLGAGWQVLVVPAGTPVAWVDLEKKVMCVPGGLGVHDQIALAPQGAAALQVGQQVVKHLAHGRCAVCLRDAAEVVGREEPLAQGVLVATLPLQ